MYITILHQERGGGGGVGNRASAPSRLPTRRSSNSSWSCPGKRPAFVLYAAGALTVPARFFDGHRRRRSRPRLRSLSVVFVTFLLFLCGTPPPSRIEVTRFIVGRPNVLVHVRMCATFIAPHDESDRVSPPPSPRSRRGRDNRKSEKNRPSGARMKNRRWCTTNRRVRWGKYRFFFFYV